VNWNAFSLSTAKTNRSVCWQALGWSAAWLAALSPGTACGSGATPVQEPAGAPFKQPGTFTLTPETTNASFTVSVIDVLTVSGEFRKAGGLLVLGPDGKPNRVDVDFSSDSADAGSDWLNEILHGPKFFDAKQHPRVAFRSARFAGDGEKLNAVEGELTLRGVAKPVTLKVNRFDCRAATADAADQRARCTAEASAHVKRTDFGMSSWLNSVSESIKIDIRFTAFAEQ
jgi:polyisoprenoid-binding protein YceI